MSLDIDDCAAIGGKQAIEELAALRARVAALEAALRTICPQCDMPLNERTALETPPHLRGPIIQAYADSNGVPPQAETIAKPPTWEDLRGAAPDATGALSSEAFVRQSRNEWGKETEGKS